MKAKSILIQFIKRLRGSFSKGASTIKTVVSKLHHKQEIQPVLLPLYPKLPDKEDPNYATSDALSQALNDPDIQNIALTGNYGSGKSSILKLFAKDKHKRVLWISFSTLGANLTPHIRGEQDTSDAIKVDSMANLIQKEIVKQILYKERYDQVPNSRFPRIFSVNIGKIFIYSLLISILASLGLNFSGLMSVILQSLSIKETSGTLLILYGALFVSLFSLVTVILTVRNKLKIDKISGGPVSISLSDANNYFDQYLDEIIYFFEVSGYDIVILEDIDRFRDLFIFENLRQLNALLNNSKQIRKKVKFIYAVKDSIFEAPPNKKSSDNGTLDDEPFTNRTKFFDLIVPTVPFITHNSSRDFITRMFKQFEIERRLTQIVSKHITDMRLLKNIFNEYIIFHEKIIKNGKIPGLSPSVLFALIVYKNKYLKDFELLSTNRSKIDGIFNVSKNFVAEKIKTLQKSKLEAESKISKYNSIARQSIQYGLELSSYIQTQLENIDAYLISIEVSEQTYTKSGELQTETFWRNIADTDESDSLKVNYKVKSSQYNPVQQLIIPLANIGDVIKDDIDVEAWKARNLEATKQSLDQTNKELANIRRNTIQELIAKYPDFRSDVVGIIGSRDDLVYELFANGYLDNSYYLYTSVYDEENVSARGMGFIIQSLQANKKEIYYTFDDEDDIRRTLEDIDQIYFESRNIYNIEIINFLVKTKDIRIAPILKNLSTSNSEDLEFLNIYVGEKGDPRLLTEHLVKIWPDVFDYIAESAQINPKTRADMISKALINASPQVGYSLNETTRKVLNEETSSIPSLNARIPEKSAVNIRLILAKWKLSFLFLSSLSTSLRDFAIESSLYKINKVNLELIMNKKSLALDVIKDKHPNVFNHLIQNLGEYFSVVRQSKTYSKRVIDSNTQFANIINIVTTENPEYLERVIQNSSNNCMLENINDVEPVAWDTLLESVKITNTLTNVISYYDHIGEVDAVLEDYINLSETIVNNDTEKAFYDVDKLKEFGISVLGSKRINALTKAVVVENLGIGKLAVSDFTMFHGKLYGHMLEKDLIEDVADTYNYILKTNWATREFFIIKSTNFSTYIQDVELGSEDIDNLISSKLISNTVKNAFIDHLEDFEDKLSLEIVNKIALFTIENKKILGVRHLAILLKDARAELSIKLLDLSIDKLSRDDLLSLLALIPGEYGKLVEPGRHPTLVNNPINLKIVEKLHKLGIVNSFKINKNSIKANIKINL